jgi:long-chain acyl-CoA synthetase
MNSIFENQTNFKIVSDCGHFVSSCDLQKLYDSIDFVQRKLVLCLFDNDIDGISGYIALMKNCAVPMLMSASALPNHVNNVISKYRPSYVFCPANNVCFNELNVKYQIGKYALFQLPASDYKIHPDLSLLLPTSGTTGNPKFVRLSYQNLISNARSIVEYLEITPSETSITTLPPTYSYGLSIIHSHIISGSTIAVTNKSFFDRDFWNFLRKVHATSFGGVPYHYEILKKLRFTRMELPSLKTLTQAGGRMDPSLTKEFAIHCQKHDMRFFTMYGQTEATARMSYLPCDKSICKAGSIGKPVPGGNFWIETENGSTIDQDDTMGELVYQGPNVSFGYAYDYNDLALGDNLNGVLRTGDLAKRDSDGYYYIIGRITRFIKLFGNRINLQDVESYLLESGYVVFCTGQDECLEVYLEEKYQAHFRDIKILILKYLQVSPLGVKIYAMNVIPRNPSGKVCYNELKPEFGNLLL